MMSFFLIIVLCIFYVCNGLESLTGYGGMVGSAHYLATQAGLNILKAGGNAADAAIAVQTTLTLVQPGHSGIGGGSFTMYYDAQMNKIYALDGREEAPEYYNPYIFCRDINCFLQNTPEHDPNNECDCSGGTILINLAWGGLSAGVPGVLHALATLHKHFGKLEWKDNFEYATDLARNGFPMYSSLYNSINGNNKLLQFNESRKLFFKDGTTEPKVEVGELFVNADLADFYDMISFDREGGIEMFYNGSIAKSIVDAVRNNIYNDRYGLMTEYDLSNYKSVFREPVVSKFGDEYTLYGMNMPSSGSISVQMMMDMLYKSENVINDNQTSADLFNKSLKDYDLYSDTTLHYLYSVQNIAFADRNQYMADADFVNVPVNGLIDQEYLLDRVKQYMSSNYTPTPIPFGQPKGFNETFGQSYWDDEGTSHYFIIDKWNNVVCTTTTIQSIMGNGVVPEGLGFLLNNQLTGFNREPFDSDGNPVANMAEGGKKQRRTALDIFDTEYSKTIGGKRPRSSMSPIIVMNSDSTQPVGAVGINGGSFIIGSVFSTISRMLAYDMDPQESIDQPRVWGQNTNSLFIESGWTANNPNLIDQMIARGYSSNQFSTRSPGQASAIKIFTGNDLLTRKGYLLFKGGADSNRYETASVMTVCQGDGTTNIPYNNTDTICDLSIPDDNDDSSNNTGLIFKNMTQGSEILIFVAIAVVIIGLIILIYIKYRMCDKDLNNYNEIPDTTSNIDIKMTDTSNLNQNEP